MGFLDALLGRTKQKPANLDALFRLPSAAVTLETSAGFAFSGRAGVCYRQVAGTGFASASSEVKDLLALDPGSGTEVREADDSYGFHWVVVEAPSLEDLVGTVHTVNSTLEEHGYGPELLCSVFGFRPSDPAQGRPVLVVYLYKRGTFYPFVPLEGERRDNAQELRVRAILQADLPVESDLTRWFPIWGAPVS